MVGTRVHYELIFKLSKKQTDFNVQEKNRQSLKQIAGSSFHYGEFLISKKDQGLKGRNLSPRKAILLSEHSSANVTSSCILSLPELTKSERSEIFCETKI